jgi:hypothetical protein
VGAPVTGVTWIAAAMLFSSPSGARERRAQIEMTDGEPSDASAGADIAPGGARPRSPALNTSATTSATGTGVWKAAGAVVTRIGGRRMTVVVEASGVARERRRNCHATAATATSEDRDPDQQRPDGAARRGLPPHPALPFSAVACRRRVGDAALTGR